jgi:AAA15 family ATPase/GTPase
MNLEHGILLMFIGMTLSVVVLFIAYYFGSKEKKKKEKLTSVQQSLRDLNNDTSK